MSGSPRTGRAAVRCIGSQFGACNELTANEHGRCRECDLDYIGELQKCELCGTWIYNEEIGEKVFGLPRNEHARMNACPWMAL